MFGFTYFQFKKWPGSFEIAFEIKEIVSETCKCNQVYLQVFDYYFFGSLKNLL